MRRKPIPPSRKARSLRELAARLSIPYERARRLRMDGLQPEPDGVYDLNKAREFLHARTLRGPMWATASKDAQSLKLRALKAAAESAEIKVALARSQLVEKAEVEREWRQRVVTVKNRLKALGRELAPRLAGNGPQEIQAVVDARVLEILRLLSHKEYMP